MNLRRNFNLILAILLLLFIGVVGISGFMIIEGYTMLEAAYMTTITVATVGFSEVRDLSDEGRMFTIVLIILSIGIFAYGTITHYGLTFQEIRLI